MSFCIRGLTSGAGRYGPTIVAQSCRLASSGRQAQPRPTSAFMHEFLGSNVPLTSSLSTREDGRLSSDATKSSSAHPRSNSVQLDQLLHNYSGYEVDCQSEVQHVARSCGSRRSAGDQEANWLHLSQLTSLGRPTKDETKVQFSALPKRAVSLTEKSTNASAPAESDQNKPSNTDLVHVYETLRVDFPAFFVKSIDYRIYHPQIEFVNNIRGLTTKGIYPYVKQMAFLRTVGHLKYAYVKMEVLKITMHTQNNTVRVRWRINGITGMNVLFNFWKFKFWKIRESLKHAEVWHDGFSTFYVGDDGLVYKHVAEKMMPDDDVETEKPKDGIQRKLAPELTFSSLE